MLLILPWMTSTPASWIVLIKRLTLVVFPGIGLDEKMTVSPGCSVTCRCIPLAIRARAAIGSP